MEKRSDASHCLDPERFETKRFMDGKCSVRTLELLGWVLFVVSSLFFISSSLKSGDVLSLVGGLLFFVACIVFLIPLFRKDGGA